MSRRHKRRRLRKVRGCGTRFVFSRHAAAAAIQILAATERVCSLPRHSIKSRAVPCAEYSHPRMATLQFRDLLVSEIRELEALKQHLMLEVVSLEQLQQGLLEQIEASMQTLYAPL
jgi:hypothetical protein